MYVEWRKSISLLNGVKYKFQWSGNMQDVLK